MRRTFLFLSVLILLASIYYVKVYERPSSGRRMSFSSESASTRILQLAKNENVSRLILRDFGRGTEFFFERVGNRVWLLRRPLDYPAESIVVEGLISLLKVTPRTRRLSLEGLEASEFGFDRPRLAVCVGVEGQEKNRCLLVGSNAAILKGAYAKWEDESEYFLIDRSFMSACDKTLYSVRRKQIFTLLEKEVRAIRYRFAKGEFEIARRGKAWMVLKPVEAILGPEAINRLLTELNGLYVKEFLDENRWDDSSLGLKQSKKVIRIEFEDGSMQTLIQGAKATGHDAYYALGEGETVLLISFGKFNQVEDAFHGLVA